MQELTRELSAAFNVCEHNNNNRGNDDNKVAMSPNIGCSKAGSNSNLEQNGVHGLVLSPSSIKLEHPHNGELLPGWQSARLELDFNSSSKLLLQGSDDPLISHGDAHDEDHPFKMLLARKTQTQTQTQMQMQMQAQQQRVTQNGACSTLTKQQLKVKASLMSARKTQTDAMQHALSTAEKAAPRATKNKKRQQSAAGALKLRFHHQALPAEYLSHYEATQGRQQQQQQHSKPVATIKPTAAAPAKQTHENVRSWLRKIAEIQRSAERQQQTQERQVVVEPRAAEAATAATTAAPPTSKRNALKYADLPYMGEITLDNYKPRRGRKPKKADICHLIYKNYGTIVPSHAAAMLAPAAADAAARKSAAAAVSEEPLNLCLRDQSNDRYSISSGDSDKPSNTDRGSCDTPTATPTEPKRQLLLQPASLYYQQLMESCALGLPVETIEKDNQLSLKIPIPSGFFGKREALTPPATPLTPGLHKRKRSAIFIPPMPAEHSSSPSNEVSICKFKFTGGAKPTLQEKKMLSVDAEGNYRYYNGTGDKTMRGYEFISREQQQQQQQQQHSHDKLYIDIPPPSTDLSLELLHIPPESPTSSLLMSSNLIPVAPPQSPHYSSRAHSPMHMEHEQCAKAQSPLPPASKQTESDRKRRSTRRSKQREKLEKTFKEKGFLIQTQQLQSAEGATYCKFRQLKKFTRYLFRNWKDHIPESDLNKQQNGSACTATATGAGGIIENLLAGQVAVEHLTAAANVEQTT